jgi:hypothetical protein
VRHQINICHPLVTQQMIAMIVILIFQSPASFGQSSSNSSQLIDGMINAQMNFDFVTLSRLEKQLSEIAPTPIALDRQASADASELRGRMNNYSNSAAWKATSKEERREVIREFMSALRKGEGITGELLEMELILNKLDTLRDDCFTAISNANHQRDRDCWLWYWLGLTYAELGENKKSEACFTIALRKICATEPQNPSLVLKDGNLSAQRFGHLYHYILQNDGLVNFCPAANHNFLLAQKEIQAELNDRLKLKYGN